MANRNHSQVFERLRGLYRPEAVRVLLVGEAPPRTAKTFFYTKGSPIAQYTEEAFVRAFGRPASSEHDFLVRFAQNGFFLDDVCHVPITRAGRKRSLERALPDFTRRLKAYSPQMVIVFVKAILPNVLQALNTSGLVGVRLALVPFPGQGWQRRYVKELTEEFKRVSRAPVRQFLDLQRAHESRFEVGRDFDGIECVVLRVQFVGYEFVQHLYFGSAAPAEKVKQTDEFLARIGCDPLRDTKVSDALTELNERYGPCVTGLRFQPNVPHPVRETPYPALHSWWQSG